MNTGSIGNARVKVMAILGQADIELRFLSDLGPGTIVELGRMTSEPLDLVVGGQLIARGEAVVIDGCFGLRVTELLEAPK